MFNFASFKAFFAVAVVVAAVGGFWLQDTKLQKVKQEAADAKQELKKCQTELETKSFEQRWSEEFSNAFSSYTQEEIKDENKTDSNSTVFIDTF